MKFHILGDKNKPVIILIHGVLTPWQVMLPIAEHFADRYCCVIPALNGHVAERKTEFISIEQEAKEIEEYIANNFSAKVFAVFGLSMGGAIAHTLWKNRILGIENIILDGAPLVKSGKILTSMMCSEYIKIVESSKRRNPKTLKNFSENFLPAKYLDDYLSFIDHMSNDSIKNMLNSVDKSRLSLDLDTKNTKAMYIHGTAVNEMLAKKSAKLICKRYPDIYVICLKGNNHCESAIYEPDDWAKIADDFLHNR